MRAQKRPTSTLPSASEMTSCNIPRKKTHRRESRGSGCSDEGALFYVCWAHSTRVLRALSMQVRSAASPCWPARGAVPPTPPPPAFRPLRGIAWTPSSAWASRPRLQLAFGRRRRICRKIRLSLFPASLEKEAPSTQTLGPRACAFCFISSKDLRISMPPKSRRKSTAGRARQRHHPLPAPTPAGPRQRNAGGKTFPNCPREPYGTARVVKIRKNGRPIKLRQTETKLLPRPTEKYISMNPAL